MLETNKLLAEGGMKDDSGATEPTTGNVVPPGALKNEVADDIDAKLSEGEFVFPADVVRYFGLQKLMKMRDEAKIGLQKMAEIGQVGNADEVANPEALHGGESASEAPSSPDFGSEVDKALAESSGTEQAFAIGGMAESQPKTDTYVNEAGQKIYVPMINGAPLIDIPMGFTKQEVNPVSQPVQNDQNVQQPVQPMMAAKGGLAKKRNKK